MATSRRSFLRRALGTAAALAVGIGTTVKAKASAVHETARSLKQAYGIGAAEQEIIQAMSEQIAREIDEEILKDLLDPDYESPILATKKPSRLRRWFRRAA